MKPSVTLSAEDAEDLEILSAQLQDAVAQVKDLVWLPKARRFAAVLNRFQWEEAEAKRSRNLRVRSGLHFENVLSAKSKGLSRANPEAVVSLLTIRFEPSGKDDCGGTVELSFSGGGAIRLEVECIEAELSDLSRPWAARGRPDHETEG